MIDTSTRLRTRVHHVGAWCDGRHGASPPRPLACALSEHAAGSASPPPGATRSPPVQQRPSLAEVCPVRPASLWHDLSQLRVWRPLQLAGEHGKTLCKSWAPPAPQRRSRRHRQHRGYRTGCCGKELREAPRGAAVRGQPGRPQRRAAGGKATVPGERTAPRRAWLGALRGFCVFCKSKGRPLASKKTATRWRLR